uniref:Intelectin n=1 Tax=Lethenteron reissneri TaxID=7753 RepID=A0AA49H394_LETRI|nr:intelectin [Lethenteron reissneri]
MEWYSARMTEDSAPTRRPISCSHLPSLVKVTPRPVREERPYQEYKTPGAGVVRTAVCFSAEDCSEISQNKWSEELPHSCLEIKEKTKTERDGLYLLQTKSGQSYQAFCDMNTNGGGWTLVASVHENNIAAKCTTGDRWTSQQGSNPAVPFVDGDKNWANLNTFGVPESATDDDYKNPGYYDLEANDIAVWHVPNGTPLPAWKTSSLFRYHTESKFLAAFGGSLYSFFKFCVGGGGYVPEASPRQCSDFSAFDWSGYGTGVEWSATKKLLESAILIYYR